MVRTVRGNLHQGCSVFQPYNGVQCTAISLIALLTFFNCSNYNVVGYLGHYHLPNIISNQNYYDTDIKYILDMYYGVINGFVSSTHGETGFYESLSQAVLLSNFHLLTLNGLTISLYCDLNSGFFYMFDSHERGRSGLYSENGASVLVEFDSFDEMASFIFDNYGQYQYDLTPVIFSTPVTPVTPITLATPVRSFTTIQIQLYI